MKNKKPIKNEGVQLNDGLNENDLLIVQKMKLKNRALEKLKKAITLIQQK